MDNVFDIQKIISVRFSNTKTDAYKKYNDTACTILARCFKNKILTYIDRRVGQSCPGGNYFLGIIPAKKNALRGTYVMDEKVFKTNAGCDAFINKLPKFPRAAQKNFVLFSPLFKETKKPDIIILLVNAAQVGRLLGLGAYRQFSYPQILPAISTCASIYAPLDTNSIHLNFIDYFDRYYQGKQAGGLLWSDTDIIVSMPYRLFCKLIHDAPLSAHGSYKPNIKPQKIDPI